MFNQPHSVKKIAEFDRKMSEAKQSLKKTKSFLNGIHDLSSVRRKLSFDDIQEEKSKPQEKSKGFGLKVRKIGEIQVSEIKPQTAPKFLLDDYPDVIFESYYLN